MQMHCPAETILKDLAISALACFHPLAVAERLETVFPNIEKIVLVDVTLSKASVNIGASGNRAVNENGADGDARAAEIEPVAHLALVGANVCLAAELRVNLAFLAGSDDEVEQLAQLGTAELQIGVVGRATDRLDTEKAPHLHLVFDEQALHFFQHIDVFRTDAGHNVVGGQTFLVGNQVNGTKSMVEAARSFAEGIVRVAQAIEANGDATHARVHQLFVHGLVIGIAVADDTPWEAVSPQLPPAIGQVGAHQRFAACDDHQDRIALVFGFQRFDGVQKILKRHVLVARRGQTVRTAVLAIKVTALRTLPKEVIQFVKLGLFFSEIVMEGLEHLSLVTNYFEFARCQ